MSRARGTSPAAARTARSSSGRERADGRQVSHRHIGVRRGGSRAEEHGTPGRRAGRSIARLWSWRARPSPRTPESASPISGGPRDEQPRHGDFPGGADSCDPRRPDPTAAIDGLPGSRRGAEPGESIEHRVLAIATLAGGRRAGGSRGRQVGGRWLHTFACTEG
jgi:hypothetical protein